MGLTSLKVGTWAPLSDAPRLRPSGQQREDVGSGPGGLPKHHEEDSRDEARTVSQLPQEVSCNPRKHDPTTTFI